MVSATQTRDAGPATETRGVLWSVATAMAYSSSSVFAKDLIHVLGVSSALVWRFGIASVVLWSISLVRRRRGGPDPFAVPKARAFGLGMMFGYMVITGFWSLNYLDASVYIVVVYLYPVLVVIASSLLGHRVSRGIWLSLLVVMVGITLTVPELFTGHGNISGLGVFLAIAQAVLMAVYMLVSSRYLPGLDGVVNSSWNVLGAVVALTPVAIAAGFKVPHGASRITEVVMFAIATAVVSNICFYRAMRLIAPGIVAMIMTLEVALAILWSVMFLGEKVNGIKLLGAAVVISGVLIAQFVNLRQARASDPDPFVADLAV